MFAIGIEESAPAGCRKLACERSRRLVSIFGLKRPSHTGPRPRRDRTPITEQRTSNAERSRSRTPSRSVRMAQRLASITTSIVELRAGFRSMKSAGLRKKRVRSSETYSVALHTLLEDNRPYNASLFIDLNPSPWGSSSTSQIAQCWAFRVKRKRLFGGVSAEISKGHVNDACRETASLVEPVRRVLRRIDRELA